MASARPALADVTANPGDRLLTERNDALLVPLADAGQVALVQMKIVRTHGDQFGHPDSGCIEHFDHGLVAKPAWRRGVRYGEQLVDILQIEELREGRPGPWRLEIVGRARLAFLLERDEPEEPADARDRPRDRPRRQPARHLRTNERFQVPPGHRVDWHFVRLRERRKRREVASVALHGVRRHTADIAEICQINVNHGSARIDRACVNADRGGV